MRKIIFMDLDGVLNPKWWERKEKADRFGCLFDAKAEYVRGLSPDIN